MAVQIEETRRPPNVVLRMFARQAVTSLQRNMQTQHVWPTEIYPGFKQVNEYRKQHGGWYATGNAAKSFQSEVGSTPGSEYIRIEFNHYLRFVDMGVGKGRPLESVERGKKARHTKRYVNMWYPSGGESHRPAIMMEARHVETRMQNYFEDFFGRELSVQVIRAFSNIKLDLNLMI